jgi:hypothetical protein
MNRFALRELSFEFSIRQLEGAFDCSQKLYDAPWQTNSHPQNGEVIGMHFLTMLRRRSSRGRPVVFSLSENSVNFLLNQDLNIEKAVKSKNSIDVFSAVAGQSALLLRFQDLDVYLTTAPQIAAVFHKTTSVIGH